ncbi:MAG: hypothetical protein JXJ04_21660 [Spirochaetales bacterium]|nr:hypothetical protein [Spirochaetales bacterium]
MSIECIHDFHFLVDRLMKKRLVNLDIFKKTRSFSGIIVKILTIIIPFIRKEHKWGEQRLSKYAAVCDDPEEIRDNVHAYIPGELYRELKLLHQDLIFLVLLSWFVSCLICSLGLLIRIRMMFYRYWKKLLPAGDQKIMNF